MKIAAIILEGQADAGVLGFLTELAHAAQIRAVVVDTPHDQSTLELIRGALALSNAPVTIVTSPVTIAHIRQRVAAEMKLTELEILAIRQMNRACNARYAIAWLARRCTAHSFPEIGRAMRRDPSTIQGQVRTAEALRASSDQFRSFTDRLAEEFEGASA